MIFYTDMFKGSYYAHPTLDKREIDDKELQAKYAMYFADNVWPSQADCPQYEMAFKELAAFMVDVGIKLAKALDALGASRYGALCLQLNSDVYSRAQRLTPTMRYQLCYYDRRVQMLQSQTAALLSDAGPDAAAYSFGRRSGRSS